MPVQQHWLGQYGAVTGLEIGLEQGAATFHKIRAPSSFCRKGHYFIGVCEEKVALD
jgi:hypothetical protein